ncbi:hypothetical protein V492_04251 [Pseudogymnoascus sp. VKM F-4246]|nr:hypothetical protein V492_04251 [Pseudogymnoascus sp. VKM F-4246]
MLRVYMRGLSFHTDDFIGALLDEQPKDGEPMKINGSCFIAQASTKEEVLAELKNDVYGKADVWDFEKIQILPFKPAIIRP